MTRINLIPPFELSRQHLVAEYRELPRIPNAVRKHVAAGKVPADFKIPPTFRLGPGHVTFFYDKLEFLRIRYKELIREMRSRGYNPKFSYPNDLFDGIPQTWMNDYVPTPEALEISRTRIAERSAPRSGVPSP